MSSWKRKNRIDQLHNAAKTGKYSWQQLKAKALAMGVTRQTAESYIQEVYLRLKKEGLLK